MKATKPGNSPWISASSQSCRRARIESIRGYSRTPLYRRRNEIERLFRGLKGFRRIFSCFDKLDLMFIAFIYVALIVEALR